MRKYETPEIKVSNYTIKKNIMDGYMDGDINENPWADLFEDPESSEPAGPLD